MQWLCVDFPDSHLLANQNVPGGSEFVCNLSFLNNFTIATAAENQDSNAVERKLQKMMGACMDVTSR